MTIPSPDYTARDFNTALAHLQAFVQQTRPDLLTDLTDGNLTTLLLELIARGVDITSYALDSSMLEAFVPTMLRRDSALRLADSVGYTPRNAAAATVVLTASTLPTEITAAGGTIAAGLVASGPNNLEWYLDAQATVPVSATEVSLTVSQKSFQSEQFSPTNTADQTVRVRTGPVNQNDFEVYVGDPTVPANLWTKVDSIELELSATNTYEVTYDEQGRLVVKFGDGVAGAIPGQSITINYFTTEGISGNVAANTIARNIAISSGGNTYSVQFVNAAAATGGQDQETLEELRVSIPAHIRSGGRAITLADFEHQAKQVPGILLSYADMRFSSYAGSVVDVNVWSSESVTFTSESDNPSAQSQTTYTRPAQANAAQVLAVKERIKNRTMTGVLPTISNPAVSYVDLYFGDVTYDSGYNFDATHQAITDAIVAAFQNSNGFIIKLADLSDAVNDVDGVLRAGLQRIVYESAQPAKASGTIVATANPSDGDWVEINDGTTTYRFEFDDDSSLVTSDAFSVTIGNSTHDTMSNLVQVINATIATLTASKSTSATPTVNINHLTGGTTYNNAITKSGSTLTVTGLANGTDTTTTVQEDFRLNTCITAAQDPWAPGTYTAGAPFVAGGSAWEDGGIEPYYDLRDIETFRDKESRDFYDEALVVNNTIVYDYVAGLTQALVLRRLNFNLIADTRD